MNLLSLFAPVIMDLDYESHPGEDIELPAEFGQRVYEDMAELRDRTYNPYQLPFPKSPSVEQRITE